MSLVVHKTLGTSQSRSTSKYILRSSARDVRGRYDLKKKKKRDVFPK